MSEISENNKRIAKNTLILYVRMFAMMLVSLYTSRIVLKALGVDDYGIYNVVGGVVSICSLLTGSLSGAIGRYITFELGKGNKDVLNKVFCTSVIVQLILSLIVIVLLETIGLWFLNCRMEIPIGRYNAANWVFQISILTFVVGLYSVPYDALIVAHERMSAFAFISIFDAIAKLGIAFLLIHNPFDRLIYYALLLFLVSLVNRFLYYIYCRKHFQESHFRWSFDKSLVKQMLGFAGWSFFGTSSWIIMSQGVNLLLNVYFGVVVNAARGIAQQVDGALNQFVTNFTKALNPQITKSYAIGNKEYMFNLMYRGAKFSYFLLLLFAVPILCCTKEILNLWLGQVPEYSVVFLRLTLIMSMIHISSNTMGVAILASGNIKKYQLVVGGLGLLVFPLSWLLFYIGYPPEMAYVSIIIVFILQFISRLLLMKESMGMSILRFIKEVTVKILIVSVFSFIFPVFICFYMNSSLERLILIGFVSVVLTPMAIYFVGLDHAEQKLVGNVLKKIKCLVIGRKI